MTTTASLGQRVKTLREKRSWRQEKLARAAGLTQPAVSRIEVGCVKQPRLSVLKRLSEALDVSVDYLISGTYKSKETSLPDSVTVSNEFKQTYEGLTESARQQLFRYARFLQEQEKKERKSRRRNRGTSDQES